MAKKDYLPDTQAGIAASLEQFRDTIPLHQAVLGLPPTLVDSQALDANWFRTTLSYADVLRNGASQWTRYKNFLLYGGDGPPEHPRHPEL